MTDEHPSLPQVNSYFRPFRAAIFKKWVNPGTKIWVRNILLGPMYRMIKLIFFTRDGAT